MWMTAHLHHRLFLHSTVPDHGRKGCKDETYIGAGKGVSGQRFLNKSGMMMGFGVAENAVPKIF